MEYNIEYFKELLKKVKKPKFNLPNINLKNIRRPPKWVVYITIILIQFIILFFILWLFDERTVFDNDYYVEGYRGKDLKFGWFHLGMIITSIITEAILFFSFIFGELMEWKDENRIFYKLYR